MRENALIGMKNLILQALAQMGPGSMFRYQEIDGAWLRCLGWFPTIAA
jgi:hypothetical protein